MLRYVRLSAVLKDSEEKSMKAIPHARKSAPESR